MKLPDERVSLSVYQDKIQLAREVLIAFGKALDQFYNVVMLIRINELDIRDLPTVDQFNWCWKNCAQIYSSLEFNYIEKLDKNDQKLIKELIEKYEDVFNKQTLSYKELKEVIHIIRRLVGVSELLDFSRITEGDQWRQYLTEDD